MREWLLGLVTTPERASAIVGDAVERPGSSGIGQMVVSIVWHDIVAERGRVAWLGFGGLVLEIMLYVFLVLSSRYMIGSPVQGAWLMFYTPLGIVAIDFGIGGLLALIASGRELAVCMAKTIPALALLTALFLRPVRPNRPAVWLLTAVVLSVAVLVPCFFGALFVRRRRVSRIERTA